MATRWGTSAWSLTWLGLGLPACRWQLRVPTSPVRTVATLSCTARPGWRCLRGTQNRETLRPGENLGLGAALGPAGTGPQGQVSACMASALVSGYPKVSFRH